MINARYEYFLFDDDAWRFEVNLNDRRISYAPGFMHIRYVSHNAVGEATDTTLLVGGIDDAALEAMFAELVGPCIYDIFRGARRMIYRKRRLNKPHLTGYRTMHEFDADYTAILAGWTKYLRHPIGSESMVIGPG